MLKRTAEAITRIPIIDRLFRHEEDLIARWAKGIKFERDFWENWLRTKGAQWPEDYQSKLDPECPLDRELACILRSFPRLPDRYHILDVGAGPLTPVGKKMAGAEVEIIAVDPLASVYDELLAAAGIEPPVRTRFAVAEGLSDFFEPSSFDLVYCANALDHSADPMRGTIEMLRVVRIGGSVVLRHMRNEAENEDYAGFHQHNFDLRDGEFVIWNKDGHTVVDKALLVRTQITHQIVGPGLHTRIVKLNEFPDRQRPDDAARERWERTIADHLRGALFVRLGRPYAVGSASNQQR